MGEKEVYKRIWNKIGFGVLFVISCFVALYILMQFEDSIVLVALAAVLLLISAFLFLTAVFSDRQVTPVKEEKGESQSAADGEFRLKITKHMKEMENTQKELIDVLKNQNTLLKNQIGSLQQQIQVLSERQQTQAKSIIKFNKENARQLAISERETLEHVMLELKKAIENNATVTADAVAASVAAIPAYTEPVVTEAAIMEEALFTGFEQLPEEASEEAVKAVLEDVSDEELFAVSEFAGDNEDVVPVIPVPEELEIPEMPADIPMPEEFEIPEMPADIPMPEEFEIPEMPADIPMLEEFEIPEMPADIPMPDELEIPEEVAVAQESVAESKPSDPGAMMSPDDIAKLLESMGN